jgi:hypothetical protein
LRATPKPHLNLARTEILRLRAWLAAERFFRALARAAPELRVSVMIKRFSPAILHPF